MKNLRDMLQKRVDGVAGNQSDTPYIFLSDGEQTEERLSAADLLDATDSIAGALRNIVAAGARVLLVFPSGLEFIKAFFGTACAGTVAVPVYPPSGRSVAQEMTHVERVALDCGAELVLTTGDYLERLAPAIAQSSVLSQLEWLATDELPTDPWRGEAIGSDALALLQYTSGSTSKPKGVMLTHGNLLANLAAIHEAFGGAHHRLRCASWLPLYHDMGLIGAMLTPIFGGAETVFMSPTHFLQRPVRWLKMIDRYRVTVSGGPNFAYDLCVRGISSVAREGLDLSSWKVAFNGSEPVRAETLARFAQRFAGHGFTSRAFMPCYGLAEAALLVAACHFDQMPTVVADGADDVDGASNTSSVAALRERVACGPCAPGTAVTIVDPVACVAVPAGVEGEIWVRSQSVAAGYWRAPDLTGYAFNARLARGAASLAPIGADDASETERNAAMDTGPNAAAWLRTGDLGRWCGNELLITGRLKDLMVINGRKLHPQDIEDFVPTLDSRFRLAGGIAFVVDDGIERLMLVQEVNVGSRDEAKELVQCARENVFQRFKVALHGVVLVKAGAVPKTFNGKLRRDACRQALANGELDVVFDSRDAHAQPPQQALQRSLT